MIFSAKSHEVQSFCQFYGNKHKSFHTAKLAQPPACQCQVTSLSNKKNGQYLPIFPLFMHSLKFFIENLSIGGWSLEPNKTNKTGIKCRSLRRILLVLVQLCVLFGFEVMFYRFKLFLYKNQ